MRCPNQPGGRVHLCLDIESNAHVRVLHGFVLTWIRPVPTVRRIPDHHTAIIVLPVFVLIPVEASGVPDVFIAA